jgi:hypothetical protein
MTGKSSVRRHDRPVLHVWSLKLLQHDQSADNGQV